MDQIGYSLVDTGTKAEIQHWGEPGAAIGSVPAQINLSNGDFVCGASPGPISDTLVLVPRMLVANPPGPLFAITGSTVTYDGTQVIVTLTYASTPTVPQTVTLLQARLALRQAGLITAVNALVQAAAPNVQDMWEYSATIQRNNPQLLALAAQLTPPLTSDQIDALFVAAAGF